MEENGPESIQNGMEPDPAHPIQDAGASRPVLLGGSSSSSDSDSEYQAAANETLENAGQASVQVERQGPQTRSRQIDPSKTGRCSKEPNLAQGRSLLLIQLQMLFKPLLKLVVCA